MLPAQLIVNGAGQRYINEPTPYSEFGFEMIAGERGGTSHIPSWLILVSRGRFANGTAALESAAAVLRRAAPIVTEPTAHAYLEQIHGTACAALLRVGSAC